MAKALFNVLFSVIKSITNIFLAPINLLVANFLPDLSSIITTFNGLVNRYITNGLAWFAELIPPNTRALIVFYILFLISTYTIVWAIHGILKIIIIIKNGKLW